jgi:hypothetical protein
MGHYLTLSHALSTPAHFSAQALLKKTAVAAAVSNVSGCFVFLRSEQQC